MPFDAHTNFAVSLVATAPSPATSGTSLVVTGGEGTRFPAVPFNATVCTGDADPTPANAEIIRVTAIATDTFTITRAQESSSARTVIVGDRIFAGPTKKTLTDVEAGVLVDPQLNGQAGIIAPSAPGWGNTSAVLTANRGYWMRFVPTRAITVTTIRFVCSTLSASKNVDVGLYDATLTKLATAGLTAGKTETAGPKTVTITSTALTAGTVYYAAFACDAGSPLAFAQTVFGSIYQFWGTAIPQYEQVVKDACFPLPSGTVTGTSPIGNGVILGLS